MWVMFSNVSALVFVLAVALFVCSAARLPRLVSEVFAQQVGCTVLMVVCPVLVYRVDGVCGYVCWSFCAIEMLLALHRLHAKSNCFIPAGPFVAKV